jgi:hypothetical protein
MEYLNKSFGERQYSRFWQELQPIVPFLAEELAMRRLCDRPYFQRIWIVQECVLAKKLHLVCGPHYCSWKKLHNFNRTLDGQHMNKLILSLFRVKLEFERSWDGDSIYEAMGSILQVADGRHCSKFHDRQRCQQSSQSINLLDHGPTYGACTVSRTTRWSGIKQID